MTQKFDWLWPRLGRGTFEHPARTAFAATASLMLARAFRLPEAYWASISALVVTQSTLGAAWAISRQRLVGTAVGALLGAALTPRLGSSSVVFGCSVFGIGVIFATLRLDWAAYRFAGITLAIIMLAGRAAPAWVMAMHRFVEVSVGIAVALALAMVWPERERRAS